MNCCNNKQCIGIENTFDDQYAISDLNKYQKNGPEKTTEILLDVLKKEGVVGGSLLDIGGGVGAISHGMLAMGLASSVCVDASPAYTRAAQKEALKRGLEDKIEFHVGNFLDIAAELEPVEIVTLDRVICCFNDMDSLVRRSAEKALKYFGLVYPRPRLFIRAGIAVFNVFQTVTKKEFRIFAHPTEAVEAILSDLGFHRFFHHRGFFWQVAVFKRS